MRLLLAAMLVVLCGCTSSRQHGQPPSPVLRQVAESHPQYEVVAPTDFEMELVSRLKQARWRGNNAYVVLTGADDDLNDDLIRFMVKTRPECPPASADLNGDGVVNVSDLLILFQHWTGEMPQYIRAVLDERKPLGPGEIHPLIPGVGPEIERRLLERFDIYLKPATATLPPILLVNCNGPNWARPDGVAWAIDQLDRAYAAGVRLALLNINHPDITRDRMDEMVERIGAWMQRHTDFRLGPYMRPAGRGGEWAGPYLLADEKGNRPADADVAWWARLAGGYDRLVLSVDASTRHAHTADFAEQMQKLGALFIGEAHGGNAAPFPTVAIERNHWRNYHRHRIQPPDARTSQQPRILWYSKHVVAETGKTVAESLYMTDADLIAMYARLGYSIVGNLESIEAWRRAGGRE